MALITNNSWSNKAGTIIFAPLYCSRQDASKIYTCWHVEKYTCWPWNVKLKILPQVKVTWWPKEVIVHMSHASWWGKLIETIHTSLALPNYKLFAKSFGDRGWPWVTSDDLSRGHLVKTCSWNIKNSLKQHDYKISHLIWSVSFELEEFQYFFIDL